MNLERIFQQMKKIEPDDAYARSSKARILGGPVWFGLPRRHPARVILQALQSGSAIALAGITLVLILGGFSLWRVLDLVGLSGLDPAGLRVEAQAVDSQIQLSNLGYAEAVRPQSTVVSALPRRAHKSLPSASIVSGGTVGGDVSTPSSTVDIDSALDILSQ